jgi:hypothetical protein
MSWKESFRELCPLSIGETEVRVVDSAVVLKSELGD